MVQGLPDMYEALNSHHGSGKGNAGTEKRRSQSEQLRRRHFGLEFTAPDTSFLLVYYRGCVCVAPSKLALTMYNVKNQTLGE